MQPQPQLPESAGVSSLAPRPVSEPGIFLLKPLYNSSSCHPHSTASQLCALTSHPSHMLLSRVPASAFQTSGSLAPFPQGLWASPGPLLRLLPLGQPPRHPSDFCWCSRHTLSAHSSAGAAALGQAVHRLCPLPSCAGSSTSPTLHCHRQHIWGDD